MCIISLGGYIGLIASVADVYALALYYVYTSPGWHGMVQHDTVRRE